MASQIGDYVHLRLLNYINGTPTRDSYYADSSKEMKLDKADNIITNNYKELRKKVSTIGNVKLAYHVQNYLNKIFSSDKNSENEVIKMRNDIINSVSKELQLSPEIINEILKQTGNIDLNLTTSNEAIQKAINDRQKQVETLKTDLMKLRSQITSETSTRTGLQRNVIEELQISNINSIISLAKNLDSTDLEIIKKVNKALSDAQNKIEQPVKIAILQKKYNVLGKKNLSTHIISTGEQQQKYVLIEIDNKHYKITLDYINATIKILNTFLHCLEVTKTQIGDVAEYSLGALAAILNEENVSDFIDSYVFGQQSNSTTIVQKFFAGNMTLQFLAEKKAQKKLGAVGQSLYEVAKHTVHGVSSDVYVSTKASQNKMDVFFRADAVQKILKSEVGDPSITAKDMSLSVKNYLAFGNYGTLTKGFGGVSGTSFLYLIQHLPIDFLNHWINLTIGHEGFDGEIEYAKTEYNTNVAHAHYLMKIYLIMIGAVGGTLKLINSGVQNNQEADYLVWNNRNTGKWNVYAMSTLLKPLFASTSIELSSYITGYNRFEKGNDWVTNFSSSIDNRLSQIFKILDTSITTHTPPPRNYI